MEITSSVARFADAPNAPSERPSAAARMSSLRRLPPNSCASFAGDWSELSVKRASATTGRAAICDAGAELWHRNGNHDRHNDANRHHPEGNGDPTQLGGARDVEREVHLADAHDQGQQQHGDLDEKSAEPVDRPHRQRSRRGHALALKEPHV